MSEFACILDFIWRRYTGVYQDKKIQKVREIGHLRHIWFEYTHPKKNVGKKYPHSFVYIANLLRVKCYCIMIV